MGIGIIRLPRSQRTTSRIVSAVDLLGRRGWDIIQRAVMFASRSHRSNMIRSSGPASSRAPPFARCLLHLLLRVRLLLIHASSFTTGERMAQAISQGRATSEPDLQHVPLKPPRR